MNAPGLRSEPAEITELRSVLTRSLDLPLNALRAFLESLDRTLSSGQNASAPLDGALEEVQRLGQNVRDLMEFTCPPTPCAMRCTANEIALTALGGLSREHRARVTLARADAPATMNTDPALLARGLRRLIENALESSTGEVLLVLRQGAGSTTFSIVDDGGLQLDPTDALRAFRSTKDRHLGLGLVLTKRDVGLLGGALELERTELGDTNVRVRVPDVLPEVAAA